MLWFIVTQQVRELESYILKIELQSSSTSSRSSTRSTSSSSSTSRSSRKRHYSELEVSSCYCTRVNSVSKSCMFIRQQLFLRLSEDILSLSWCIWSVLTGVIVVAFMLCHFWVSCHLMPRPHPLTKKRVFETPLLSWFLDSHANNVTCIVIHFHCVLY